MHHSVDKRKSKLTEASNIIINCVFSYVFGPKTRNLHCFYIFLKKRKRKNSSLNVVNWVMCLCWLDWLS